jgi:hypothetical protein
MDKDVVGVTIGAPGQSSALALLHARREVGPKSPATFQVPVKTIWTVIKLERFEPRTPDDEIIAFIRQLWHEFPINEPTTRFDRVAIDSNGGRETATKIFRDGLDGISLKAVLVTTGASDAGKVSRQELLTKLRQKNEREEFEILEDLPLASELRAQMQQANQSEKWREQGVDDDLLSAAALALWRATRPQGGFRESPFIA